MTDTTTTQTQDDRVQEARIDEIQKTIRYAGRFALSPLFSVWRVSASGEYFQLYFGRDSRLAARHFLSECLQPFAVGVEVRCDGIRVDL